MGKSDGTLIDVGASADITELGRLIVDVGDRTIGIFRVDGVLHGYENECPHQGGPICQGKIMPKVLENIGPDGKAHGMAYDRSEMHIVCPWHGAEFVITTGQHATVSGLELNEVEVNEEGGRIYVLV
jgi:nitrite reductase/ring-hydroxylating ferredoxin subunit